MCSSRGEEHIVISSSVAGGGGAGCVFGICFLRL